MISAYAAANIIMAALWAVFVPSYALLAACERKKDTPCEPTFWMAAGAVLQDLWYPGTVRIKAFGATGNNRYMPYSEQNVLRPACIPCPTRYVNDLSTNPFRAGQEGDRVLAGSGNPVVPPTSTDDEATRLRCVRIPGYTLNPNVKFSGGKLGTPMTAKEYVWFQLFGKEWQAVHDTLLATANQTGKVDLYALQHKWNGKDQIPYNTTLFKHGTPFPWLRMKLTRLYKYEPVDPNNPGSGTRIVYRDAPVDYTVDGYYVVNGVPFCPPKLWHFWKRPANSSKKSASDWSVWYPPYSPSDSVEYTRLDTVVSSQPVHLVDLPSMCMPSSSMMNYCDKSDFGWYKHADKDGTKEYEWWYPDLPYTSIFAWEEQHYQDYIGRFFAGGDVTSCVWHPLNNDK
jgi:hypothetical protein